MRIVVITSCTGKKSIDSPNRLTLEDFQRGHKHVLQRERELKDQLVPAEELYAGQQHVRLMRGVQRFRHVASAAGHDIDLWILSAGYGLIPATQKIAPYEATFEGMPRPQLREWADRLNVPQAFRAVLKERYDLAIVALGDTYLQACAMDGDVQVGGVTLLICGSRTASQLPRVPSVRTVVTSKNDAKRFNAMHVWLKGELAARLIDAVAVDPSILRHVTDPAYDVLGHLKALKSDSSDDRGAAKLKCIPNPKVDVVIQIPRSWWERPHRKRLRYFIPEWKDLVDPEYDFQNDEHSGGKADWSNEVYAHQMFPEPNYDGILVSRSVIEPPRPPPKHGGPPRKKEPSKTAKRLYALGIHRMLRVPREFPVMGDCGAFGYKFKDDPLYSTRDVVEYYTRAGFDYGVSVDHLILSQLPEDKKRYRYDLTIANAEDFLREHRGALEWTPIGAVQGWDPKSYADAAAALVKMGYKRLAIGAVARRNDAFIKTVVAAVHPRIPAGVELHVLGVARLSLVPFYLQHGVTSMDSASSLRQAWMGPEDNYHTPTGHYSAVRIRHSEEDESHVDELEASGRITRDDLKAMEKSCLAAVRAFDSGRLSAKATAKKLAEYESYFSGDHLALTQRIQKLLSDAPWRACPCPVCRDAGIDVVIWRGNNRNRRRGFHNTYVYYRALADEVAHPGAATAGSSSQLPLPLGKRRSLR